MTETVFETPADVTVTVPVLLEELELEVVLIVNVPLPDREVVETVIQLRLSETVHEDVAVTLIVEEPAADPTVRVVGETLKPDISPKTIPRPAVLM